MASSSDVVKKVTRFKLQLTAAAEPATVLKILQKLKDLDITLDVIAETGIGKTVNSLRRHEQAGELAKSLVRGWKRLLPKESTSHTGDEAVFESLSVKEERGDQNCPSDGSLTKEDLNNNCLKSHKILNPLDDTLFKMGKRRADSEEKQEEPARCEDQNNHQENHNVSQNDDSRQKMESQEDKTNNSVGSEEKINERRSRKSGDGNRLLGSSEDTLQKSRSHSKEEIDSDSGGLGPEKESHKKSKKSQESFSFESSDKYSKTLKLANVKEDGSPGISEAQNRKRKKTNKEKKEKSESKSHSKQKKAKIKHKDDRPEEPSMSFESYLNYDVNVVKRRDRSGVKKPPKNIKGALKRAVKDPDMKSFKSPVMSVASPKQQFKDSVMDLINIPLPAVLPECEKLSPDEYFERKVEKESDLCEVSDESAVFTGQRLNKKMQVYSGAKTVFLPTMMSLHQQCIRTLQNNINLLYETGGVPFEILEPVLERCTPEQLLRIEEFNPIYIGVTDHLWGKHCQRDFKDSKLQEYESWKEMYVRRSEERERKLQRLTKSIVSAHSNKPKGRQVKMAFIHTVAKPPRDVRIQQEIHGTAVQQPHQSKCSVKVQDNRSRPSSNEPSRSSRSSSSSSSSSSASAAANAQDPRKKTIAPMMAKSLKAFKKQQGRR